MKFTLSWLKEHLDTTIDLESISSILTDIGLEVESIKNRSSELKPFTVAKVKSVVQHPSADRLKVCEVETINGDIQIVCGAPNAKSGMLSIFAPEDSFIPGTNVKLEKTKIRGIESYGMLVSEKEMGISDNHDSIIEIDSQYKIGDAFSQIYGLDDPIIEINITPNRSDCLSVKGIARDLAAAGIGKLKNRTTVKVKGTFDSPIKWNRQFNETTNHLCPGVAGRFFSNVKNCESPDWLKKRLEAIGLRPISALVDITNFITFDLGRPLHVFDADKLEGNLSMRLASDKEICKALDENEYKLTNDMVVISDDKEVQAIGGVMGGLNSRCSLETKNVFLEVALFDPISITKTGRRLNLQSDARFRFERGVDPISVDWGVDEATKMILELCGGQVSYITSDISSFDNLKSIDFPINKTLLLGGIDIPKSNQVKILENLGFVVKTISDKIVKVTVPTFRPDINGIADIVEEIIRIYGYNKIQPQSVVYDLENKQQILSDHLKTFYKSKRLLSSRGYYETVTWSFMSFEIASLFNKKKMIHLKNPISSDLDVLRPTILPNLLAAVAKNTSRLYYNGKIFEVGPQFNFANKDQQEMMATGIQYGPALPQLWNHENRLADVFDIKSDVLFVLDQLNISVESLQHETVTASWYHPGKSALLKIGKSPIAIFGEIHPLILGKFEIKNAVCGFEIYLDQISQFLKRKVSTKSAYDNNSLQAVERDFAFLFNENVKAIDIIQTVKKIDKQRIKKVTIFDVFVDESLFKNMKSIAFKVILQPIENTFTDIEIEQLSKKIINNISTLLGGQLR